MIKKFSYIFMNKTSGCNIIWWPITPSFLFGFENLEVVHKTMLTNPIFARWRTFVIWTTLVNKKFCFKNRASRVEWKLASVLRITRALFNIRAYSCATTTLRPNDIIQIRILHVSNVCERWGVSIIHCIDKEDWYILLPFRDIRLHNKLCVHSRFWCLEIIFTNMIDIE